MTDTRWARSFRRWKRSLATCWIAASPMPVIAATTPPPRSYRVYTTDQKRRLTPQIKREFKRRAAIEPVIGHLKEHHRMGRNHLAPASGDAINAVLAAAGYNFRRFLAWLRLFLLRILIALGLAAQLKLL
jgi:IS5 family transposase